MTKPENMDGISIFFENLSVNTADINFTMLSKLRISGKLQFGVECSLLCAKKIVVIR